jgi:hypothetical protein
MANDAIPVIDPTGTARMIPSDQVQAAVAAGGKLAAKMLDPQGTARWVPADQVNLAQDQGGTPVNADQSFTVTPAPGENFLQTMQRAAAAGRNVSPQLIQQQAAKGIKDVPLALGAAAAAGPVILGSEAAGGALFGPSATTVSELAESGTNASLARQGLSYAAQKGA